MRYSLMFEGQEGVTWDEWLAAAAACERLGFEGLFSSDHYFGPGAISEATGHRPVYMAPLTSIAMATALTSKLLFVCRVFACYFHNPVLLAK